MLKTFAREDWHDPSDMDKQIEHLMKVVNPSPEELRAVFPYKGVVLKNLLPYRIPAGTVLPYIRVKHEVSLYPFIGIIGVPGVTEWGLTPKRLILDSSELQVVEV